MDYLRGLLQLKKNENKEGNKGKIDILTEMLQDDTLFLKIDADTAVGILDFLGVPKEAIKNVYMDLLLNGKDLEKENKQYYVPRD